VAVAAIISGSGSLLIWSRNHSTGSENEQQVFSIADSYQPKHSTLPSKSAELDKLMFTPGAVGTEVVEACVGKIPVLKSCPMTMLCCGG